MKRTVLGKQTLFLAMLATISLVSCKKDTITLRDMIVGDWEVTSFSVDGVELIAAGASFTMEYDEYSGEDGDFEWVIIESGATERYVGDYEVDNLARELKVTPDGEAPTKLDLDIQGNKMELSGNVDGYRWEIEAKRD